MKRILFSMLSVAGLLATSCAKDVAEVAPTAGEQNVTIAVALDSASSTRAISDYGTGADINRCILEVYTTETWSQTDVLYKRMVAEVKNGQASFDLRLVNTGSYEFVAWADCDNDTDLTTDNWYKTTGELGLRCVELNDVVAGSDSYLYASNHQNDDTRDAFFGNKSVDVSGATNVDMVLTRPFGQLSIITKLTDVPADSRPVLVSKRFIADLNRKFDAKAGDVTTAGEDTEDTINPDDQSFVPAGMLVNGDLHISTEYIFAPKDAEFVIPEIQMAFMDNQAYLPNGNYRIQKLLNNIPIKRNYRTIVTGEMLTVDGHIDITIDPNFADENQDQVSDDILYLATNTTYQQYARAIVGELVIPEGITSLGAESFCYAHIGNEELVIPSSVATTGNLVFCGVYSDPEAYNSFTKAVFTQPGSLKKLEMGIFQANWQLEEIELPSSLETIEGNAFYGCGQATGAVTITMPSASMVTVANIGTNVDYNHAYNPFNGTSSIATSKAAYKNDVNITIKVPAALVSTYEADAAWQSVMANKNVGNITFAAM